LVSTPPAPSFPPRHSTRAERSTNSRPSNQMTGGGAGRAAARVTARRATARAQQTAATPVEVQMRHVDFRVDSTVVLRIAWLRGRLERTAADQPPYFDD